ncbi:metallophosphoesterase [Draconibacterium orientale]|uniref:metallophosphoesterase n=1 Tax=Draconibacterium orientale TaxID=1168034 RepID=UPI0029C0C318|nr:metallophosphoesterase [Draconibacterium orientale]
MIIQYCSDLHLEFPENKKFLIENPIIPVGEILILAGDIVPFRVMHEHSDFWNYISSNFKNVYWIPGNHEYYYFDIKERLGSFVENIRDNILLVNNTSFVHNKTRFIFTTLWTAISEAKKFMIQQGLSDFRVIRNNGQLLIPDDYNQMHKSCMQYLNHELSDGKFEKTIVVTHHVPTMLNYPEKYQGSYLNEAFAVELYDLIIDSDIDYWIFGHHHQNHCDFTIGKTRMLSSQLGYVQFDEHKDFSTAQYFHI